MKPLLTEEDKEIAFEFIILNLLLQALERDIAAIESSKLKLRKIHTLHLNKVHKDFSNILIEHKKTMRKLGIKVMERVILSEEFWGYQYFVRGYQAEYRVFTYALKIHVEKRLESYYQDK
jgi:ribonuclease BN (tRNA processing enzyme)